MTVGFLFLVPLTIGYLTVRPVAGASLRFRLFAPWISCAFVILGSVITGLEGSICVIFASPAMLLFASIGGMLAGALPGVNEAVFGAVVAGALDAVLAVVVAGVSAASHAVSAGARLESVPLDFLAGIHHPCDKDNPTKPWI